MRKICIALLLIAGLTPAPADGGWTLWETFMPRPVPEVSGHWTHGRSVSSKAECIREGRADMKELRKGQYYTAPAVQDESDVLRSVRVQPCIRPVFAWRLAPLRCSRCGRWP